MQRGKLFDPFVEIVEQSFRFRLDLLLLTHVLTG
jgi:hypothetical protein